MGASLSSLPRRVALLALLSGASLGCFYFYKAHILRRVRHTSAFPLNPNPKPNGNPNPKPKGKLLFAWTGDRTILSHRLRSILSYYCIDVDLIDPNDYQPEDLPNESLVLIVASSGKDGKAPPHAEALSLWLSERAEDLQQPKPLEGCNFAVFWVGSQENGQGNDSFGRDLVRWMSYLGASEILPLGEEDEDCKELEDVFACWILDLVLELRALTEKVRVLNNWFSEDCVDPDNMDGTDESKSGVKVEEHQAKPNGEMVPNTGRSQEHQKRGLEQGSIFYILLEHTKDKLNDDLMLKKSDVFTVASLYRVRVAAEDKSDDSVTLPLGSSLFNLTSDKYPSGMGCGALGRQLFFVGGQFHDTKSAADDSLQEGRSKIYVLDTSFIDNSTTENDISKNIVAKDSMNLNKNDPIVVTAQNKLFVLPNNFGSNGMNPTIESYDPARDRWESYDIFENYKGNGYLKTHPPLSPLFEVLAHCVKDSIIYVCLCLEAYAFDVNTGNLYLVGNHRPLWAGPPFNGMGMYVDGCFLGIDSQRKFLCIYNYNPFKGRLDGFKYLDIKPNLHVISKFVGENMQGTISYLEGTEEPNKLLAVRTAHSIGNEVQKELYLVFDFLRIGKEVKGGLTCKTDNSIIYHMDNWNGPCGDIKACFPMS